MTDLVEQYINLRTILASGMRDGQLLTFDDCDEIRCQFVEIWNQMNEAEQREAYKRWNGKEPPKRVYYVCSNRDEAKKFSLFPGQGLRMPITLMGMRRC
jgi:hypothetical protein